MTENEIGAICLETAIALHRELGPGLLESVYEITMAHELSGAASKSRVSFPFQSFIAELFLPMRSVRICL